MAMPFLVNSFNSSIVVSAIGLMLGSATMAQGQVPPEIHKTCTEARDYSGCVSSMLGTALGVADPNNRTIDQTIRPGLLAEMGNQCPSGYAYAGGGQCRSIQCRPMGLFGKNEPQLAGKGHTCKDKNREYGIGGRASLRWGDNYTSASINPSCPHFEMGIGDPNSCYTARKTGKTITTGIWPHDERNSQGYFVVKDCVGTCKENNLDIQPGDILISRNGRPIQNVTLRDGERLTYVVERNGKRHTITAVAVTQVLAEVQGLP